MAKILITGSKGVVGSWLIKILSERGHAIFGVDLTHHAGSVGFEHEMSRSDFTYARCDVGNYRQLERIFEKAGPFDYVYHCAAEFGRWNGEDYYEQVWMTNAIGTKNVIRLQEKLGFKLIHFSSSEVYGDYPNVMTEDIMDKVEIKQMNDYALSKWVNEQQIRNSTIKHGTKTITVRLFNTYGPGEWYHPYRSVNCKFCYHALHGIPVIAFNKGASKEIIVGGKTGEFFENQSATSLINVLKNFKKDKYNEKDCYNNGLRFSSDNFRRELSRYIKNAIINNP